MQHSSSVSIDKRSELSQKSSFDDPTEANHKTFKSLSTLKSRSLSAESEEDTKSPTELREERRNGGKLIRMASEARDPSEFAVENICGKIKFTVEYDTRESSLIVKIIDAKGLPAKDATGTSDPYVRVTLLPDKKHKIETKIKRRTLNPKWNETLYFQDFPITVLQTRTLHLHVLDWDRFSRDDPIGEVSVPLHEVDLSYQLEFTRNLKPTSKLGEVLLTLNYNARDSILIIKVMKARNLKIKDITGSSDPYVKIWLHQGDKKLEKRKTKVLKCSLNPVYEEAFEFNVQWALLRNTSLVVTVMDYDTVGRNEMIGKVILAAKSGPMESKHWNEMIANPGTDISFWHPLMS
ncbi:SYT7 (predicted) [Pycnogonum litorale]